MPASFQSFELELNRLVGIFERNLPHYKSTGYDEASLRQEFLNPLFRALGWDVENLAGFIPIKREVEVESRTQISGRQKRADYLFRTEGRDRWVCEAKKPAETLDARCAFQAKRHSWNKDQEATVNIEESITDRTVFQPDNTSRFVDRIGDHSPRLTRAVFSSALFHEMFHACCAHRI